MRFTLCLVSALALCQSLFSQNRFFQAGNDSVYFASQKDDVHRWIVKFKPAPQETAGRGTDLVDNVHSQFLKDLKKINGSLNAREQNPIEIFNEYKIVFNGFSLSVSNALKSKLEKLPYVESIRKDQKLKPVDLASSTVINAPAVWTSYGVTGKGISIAIIDTGIDYNHPDLGGGFGEGHKVRGGYDFADMDNDPMDDHGHGTHVAGIAAASGPGLKGVAPDAFLYAYKVYSAEGFGYDSWIIAAIEHCFNPDLDASTNDMIQVINISFGRPYDPYEPLSEVVNNAVSKGMTVVVAAGNEGRSETIYTPGVAQDAITVGATSTNDETAYFSSKGPTTNYNLKPDVGAPGVNIYSSYPANSYSKETGTSMAAPHVAGAVALLKEKHPDWTPSQIKGALMGTAISTSENILYKGAGRIDVLKALESNIIVTPGSLSLGLISGNLTTTAYSKTITIRNTQSFNSTVILSAYGEGVGNGVDVSFDKPSVVIPPNTSIEIRITFNIDVPSLKTKIYPACFTGSIVSSSENQIINTPFSFFHSEGTNLQFDGGLPDNVWVIGTEANTSHRILYPTTEKINAVLSEGSFDLISHYPGNRIVIKENVTIPEPNTIVINKADAKNEISFNAVDLNYFPIPLNHNNSFLTISAENKNFYGFYSGVNTIFISNLSDYKINFRGLNITSDGVYDISLSSPPPTSSSKEIINDPGEFTVMKVRNPDIAENSLNKIVYHIKTEPFAISSDTTLVPNPFNILMTRNEVTEMYSSSFAHLFTNTTKTWQTGAFTSRKDDTFNFMDLMNNHLFSIPGTSYYHELGQTLPTIKAYTTNQTNKLRMIDLPALGTFKYSLGEYMTSGISYKVKAQGATIAEGTYFNRTTEDLLTENSTFPELEITSGPYSVELTMNEHSVSSKKGFVRSVYIFDTNRTDKDSPVIEELILLVNDMPSNSFLTTETGILKLRIGDNCYLTPNCDDPFEGSVEVFIQEEESTDWISLEIPTDFSDTHELKVPDNVGAGYYNLKIIASDHSGNTIEHLIAPAFQISDTPPATTLVTLISPVEEMLTTTKPLFKWSELSLVNLYEIQISTSNTFSGFMKAICVDAHFQLPSELDFDRVYFWRIRPVFKNNYPGQWSGTSSFRTVPAFYELNLISPENNSVEITPPVNFLWEELSAPIYFLQISVSEAFDNNVLDTVIKSNSTSFDKLDLEKIYYWRVGYKQGEKLIWSTTHQLSTETITGIESTGKINYVFNRPNPFSQKTEIIFKTSSSSPGKLLIYNMLGALVDERIVNCENYGEEQQLTWPESQDEIRITSGIYIAKLRLLNEEKVFRMVVRR